jgi:hypothetical protein
MSSLKQIEANRRNALKSTGPSTHEGKQRSRCNAVRHGLTAETVIGDLEDSEDYQAFEAAVTADYDAQTAIERELVLRLASILWRLRRATGIEASLFQFVGADPRDPDGEPSLILIASQNGAQQDSSSLDPACHTSAHTENDAYLATQKTIGDRYLRLTALPTFPLDRLSRYEQTLWRQARQITFTLESLRRRSRHQRSSIFSFQCHTKK